MFGKINRIRARVARCRSLPRRWLSIFGILIALVAGEAVSGPSQADECDQSDAVYSVKPNINSMDLAGEYRATLARGTEWERCFSLVINEVDGNRIGGTLVNGAFREGFGYERDFSAQLSNGKFHFQYKFHVLKWVYENSVSVEIKGPWKVHIDLSNNHGTKLSFNPKNISRYDLASKQLIAAPAVTNTTPFAWPKNMAPLTPAEPSCKARAKLPSDVVLVAPESSTAAEYARFSGVWSGWMCVRRRCSVQIAVEEVGPGGAVVVYASVSDKREQHTERISMTFRGDELFGRLGRGTGANLSVRLRGDDIMELLWGKGDELLFGILTRDR